MKGLSKARKEARERILAAQGELRSNLLLGALASRVAVSFEFSGSDDGFAYVTEGHARWGDPSSVIYANDRKPLPVTQWKFVLAHCLLHLGFGHFRYREDPRSWNYACCLAVDSFLRALKLGSAPYVVPVELPGREEAIYNILRSGRPPWSPQTANGRSPDMAFGESSSLVASLWERTFAEGVLPAARRAVAPTYTEAAPTIAEQARHWFLGNCPLLGAVAQQFDIVEDPETIARMDIRVAAIDVSARKIYVNATIVQELEEAIFVLGHEFLHAALCHHGRVHGRDELIWGYACDFVVNDWLVQMGMGRFPRFGGCHDEQFRDMSVEAVYDVLARDLAKARRLTTFKGKAMSDMLARTQDERIDRDEALRQALLRGFWRHLQSERGLLPAGLLEEIRAIEHPAPPWDVQLARWFDETIPGEERVRTFARPSRRQQASPNVPLPRYMRPQGELGETFGVLLDTSGSVPKKMIAESLGAIASLAEAKSVRLVRVVCCDAEPYDLGYLSVDQLTSGPIAIRGRGGTVLQPGIDLLEKARDFPDEAPILIVTDTSCDVLRIARAHAFLVPELGTLPFPPRGPVFRIR